MYSEDIARPATGVYTSKNKAVLSMLPSIKLMAMVT
jgi:hypothetical protein